MINHVIHFLMFLARLLSKATRLTMTRNAVWALSNLCRGKHPPPEFSKVAPCLPVLSRLLLHTDADVLSDACWALSYLSDGPNDKIQVRILPDVIFVFDLIDYFLASR